MKLGKILNNCKIILTIILFLSILYSTNASFWADLDQPHRQEINLSGATSTIQNYTYEFTMTTANTGPNFNFSTHRDSLRFYYYNTTSGTSTLIPHNVLSSTTISATLQIKVPKLTSSQNSSIWMYYGDLSKPNNESYCDVFIYCDFFDDASIDSKLNTADLDTVGGTAFSEGSGVLSITAGGTDTWTGSDQYGTVYLDNIDGDVDIRVTVVSSTATNAWTKAGIMIKNDITSSGSSTGYSFMTRTPGNGYAFQRDENNNGFLESNTNAGSPSISPSHVRLVKRGNSHEGYYSKTTQDIWNLVTAGTVTSTNSISDIGLSLTSHGGGTLATATFDNFTIRRYTADTITSSFGSEQELSYLSEIKSVPSPLTITNILQNNTFEVNITLSCNGDSTDCFNVTGTLQYNNSGTFQDISESSTTPLWSILSKDQSCIIGLSSSCTYTWVINATGAKNSLQKIRGHFSSNNSRIASLNSSSIQIKIVIGNTLKFNQSSYYFGSFLKNSGNINKDINLISDNGNNSNIHVSCQSGDCTQITQDWSNGDSLLEGNSEIVTFTCDDSTSGTYNAIYNVTSDEYDGYSEISLMCEVLPIYGPMLPNLNSPLGGVTTLVGKNQTFTLNSSIECTGLCGEITATAIYYGETTLYKRNLEVSISDPIPSNYQILLEFNETNLGTNFNWTNNCADLEFKNNSNELDYYVEICDIGSKEISVWVETDTAMTSNSTFTLEMYYGNSSAISKSNASNTFRQDQIHLTTGRCPSGVSGCEHINNLADSQSVKEDINNSDLTIDGVGYVTQIDNPGNPYGADDYFFMRYRTLYIPSSGGSFSFGIASDDGSNIGLWNKDGYGYGLSTPASITAIQDIVSDWYGGHGTDTCGASAANEGTRVIVANTPYWIDFVMDEGNGAQDSEICIDTGSGYNTFGIGSFSGEFYARTYVENEPQLNSIGNEQTTPISTNLGETPFYTLNTQPQICTPIEDGICSFEWIINATGLVNTSWDVAVFYSSNISSISDVTTNITTINITDNIIPTITLISPVNNSKIINNGTTTFTWRFDDDDTVLVAELYLNGVFNLSALCISGNNCSRTLNLDLSQYDWEIRLTDTDGNFVTSETYKVYSIKEYHNIFTKKIKSSTTNIYFIELSLENKLTYSKDYTILDFVPYTFNHGSFSLIYSFLESIAGIFTGDIPRWNLSVPQNTTQEINYSITNINSIASLRDVFIISSD